MVILRVAFLIDAGVSMLLAGALLWGRDAVVRFLFGEHSCASRDIQMLIGAMWFSFAICLLMGIAFPLAMSTVLIAQLIYKTIWLMAYALPKYTRREDARPPLRLVGLFCAYVVIFPWLIPWSKVFILE